MNDLDAILKNLDSRDTGTLDTTRFGYKLAPEGGTYGMDVNETPAVVDERKMCVELIYADGNRRDGVGDLLEIGGIDLTRHHKNPIVLFDHGKEYKLPIAKTEDPENGDYKVSLDVVSKQAKAVAYFYQSDSQFQGQQGAVGHGQFCEQIFDLLAKKFIRAGSIGYLVKSARELPADPIRGIREGKHLLGVMQIDVSVVVLPCNADTVKMALALPTVCGKSLHPYLVKTLTPFAGEKTVQMGYVEQKTVPDNTSVVATPSGEDHSKKHEIPPPDSRQQFLDTGVSPEDHKSGDWTEPAAESKPADMKAIRLKYRKKANEIDDVSDGKAGILNDPTGFHGMPQLTPEKLKQTLDKRRAAAKGPIQDTTPPATGFPSPSQLKADKPYSSANVAKLAGTTYKAEVDELKTRRGTKEERPGLQTGPVKLRSNKFGAAGALRQQSEESGRRVAAGASRSNPVIDTSKLTAPKDVAYARTPHAQAKTRGEVRKAGAPPAVAGAVAPTPGQPTVKPASNKLKDNTPRLKDQAQKLAAQANAGRLKNTAGTATPTASQPAAQQPKPGTQPTKGGNKVQGYGAARMTKTPDTSGFDPNAAARSGGSAGQNKVAQPGQKPAVAPQPGVERRDTSVPSDVTQRDRSPYRSDVVQGRKKGDDRSYSFHPPKTDKPVSPTSTTKPNNAGMKEGWVGPADDANQVTYRGNRPKTGDDYGPEGNTAMGPNYGSSDPLLPGTVKTTAGPKAAKEVFPDDKFSKDPASGKLVAKSPPTRPARSGRHVPDLATANVLRKIESGRSKFENQKSLTPHHEGKDMADEPADTTPDDNDNEPYGAQLLRRLHADKQDLMRDYDGLMGPLDNPKIRKRMEKILQGIERVIQDVEADWDGEYGERGLRDLDGRVKFDDDGAEGKGIADEEETENEPPGDEAEVQEDEDAVEDEGSDDGDLTEEGEEAAEGDESTEDAEDDAGVQAQPSTDTEEDGTTTSSNVPEETPPEEAVAAMGIGRQNMKDLRLKYQSKNIACDACGCEPCECVEDVEYAPEGAANEPGESLADGRDDFEAIDDAREQAHIALEASHVSHVRNAAGFLSQLGHEGSVFERSHQLDAYHHGKNMHAVRDHLGQQLEAAGKALPDYNANRPGHVPTYSSGHMEGVVRMEDAPTFHEGRHAEEYARDSHVRGRAPAGGGNRWGASNELTPGSQIKDADDMMQGALGDDKFMGMHKTFHEAGDWLDSISRKTGLGLDDRDKCMGVCKALSDIADEHEPKDEDDNTDDESTSEDESPSDESDDATDDPGASEDTSDEDTPDDTDDEELPADEDEPADEDSSDDDEYVGEPGRKSAVLTKSLRAALRARDAKIDKAERSLKELLDRFAA